MKQPARKLKVFRTAAGFYDAYVAAPTQKAAIEAWGADPQTFARGDAEVVTDPALTAEPLARPGEVIRKKRGDLADQLAALGTSSKPAAGSARFRKTVKHGAEARSPRTPAKPEPKVKSKPKPRPKPSRAAVDSAELDLRAFEAEAKKQLGDIRQREEDLARERRQLEARHEAIRGKHARALETARAKYDRALEGWRRSLES